MKEQGALDLRKIHDTQLWKILEYMTKNGSIDRWQAESELHVLSLSKRISELKDLDFDISGEMVTVRDYQGHPLKVKRYFLKEAAR